MRVHDRSAPERRGLADAARLQEPIEVVAGGGIVAEDSIIFVDEMSVAVEQVPIGMVAEMVDGGRDGAGMHHVVGVEPGEDLALGPAESLVDGVALAGVALEAPEKRWP